MMEAKLEYQRFQNNQIKESGVVLLEPLINPNNSKVPLEKIVANYDGYGWVVVTLENYPLLMETIQNLRFSPNGVFGVWFSPELEENGAIYRYRLQIRKSLIEIEEVTRLINQALKERLANNTLSLKQDYWDCRDWANLTSVPVSKPPTGS